MKIYARTKTKFTYQPFSKNYQYLNKTKSNALLLIIGLLLIISTPILIFGQLPNLGVTENFAVFTSIGELSNFETSDIRGDIGTNNGPFAGFGSPTLVQGTIEWQNSISAQAVIDVQIAYDDLFNRTPTVLGHQPEFGNGETLT